MPSTPKVTAFSLYLSTCRYVLKAKEKEPESWSDLHLYLPYLRQALSCCVCSNILDKPMGHSESPCLHVVCQRCVGGKMKLKPSCSWCKDWSKFVTYVQLEIIVKCYKKLCDYIFCSSIMENFLNDNVKDSKNSLYALIREGCTNKDNENIANVHFNKLININKFVEDINSLPPKLEASQPVRLSPPTLAPEIGPENSQFKFRQRHPSGKSCIGNNNGSSIVTCDFNQGDSIAQNVTTEHDYIKQDTNFSPITNDIESDAINKLTMDNSIIKKKKRTRSIPNDEELCIPLEKKTRSNSKKHQLLGCRCGMATPNPGKLTCCGQRCPCYSMFKGCTHNCKCRGCRNSR